MAWSCTNGAFAWTAMVEMGGSISASESEVEDEVISGKENLSLNGLYGTINPPLSSTHFSLLI